MRWDHISGFQANILHVNGTLKCTFHGYYLYIQVNRDAPFRANQFISARVVLQTSRSDLWANIKLIISSHFSEMFVDAHSLHHSRVFNMICVLYLDSVNVRMRAFHETLSKYIYSSVNEYINIHFSLQSQCVKQVGGRPCISHLACHASNVMRAHTTTDGYNSNSICLLLQAMPQSHYTDSFERCAVVLLYAHSLSLARIERTRNHRLRIRIIGK